MMTRYASTVWWCVTAILLLSAAPGRARPQAGSDSESWRPVPSGHRVNRYTNITTMKHVPNPETVVKNSFNLKYLKINSLFNHTKLLKLYGPCFTSLSNTFPKSNATRNVQNLLKCFQLKISFLNNIQKYNAERFKDKLNSGIKLNSTRLLHGSFLRDAVVNKYMFDYVKDGVLGLRKYLSDDLLNHSIVNYFNETKDDLASRRTGQDSFIKEYLEQRSDVGDERSRPKRQRNPLFTVGRNRTKRSAYIEELSVTRLANVKANDENSDEKWLPVQLSPNSKEDVSEEESDNSFLNEDLVTNFVTNSLPDLQNRHETQLIKINSKHPEQYHILRPDDNGESLDELILEHTQKPDHKHRPWTTKPYPSVILVEDVPDEFLPKPPGLHVNPSFLYSTVKPEPYPHATQYPRPSLSTEPPPKPFYHYPLSEPSPEPIYHHPPKEPFPEHPPKPFYHYPSAEPSPEPVYHHPPKEPYPEYPPKPTYHYPSSEPSPEPPSTRPVYQYPYSEHPPRPVYHYPSPEPSSKPSYHYPSAEPPSRPVYQYPSSKPHTPVYHFKPTSKPVYHYPRPEPEPEPDPEPEKEPFDPDPEPEPEFHPDISPEPSPETFDDQQDFTPVSSPPSSQSPPFIILASPQPVSSSPLNPITITSGRPPPTIVIFSDTIVPVSDTPPASDTPVNPIPQPPLEDPIPPAASPPGSSGVSPLIPPIIPSGVPPPLFNPAPGGSLGGTGGQGGSGGSGCPTVQVFNNQLITNSLQNKECTDMTINLNSPINNNNHGESSGTGGGVQFDDVPDTSTVVTPTKKPKPSDSMSILEYVSSFFASLTLFNPISISFWSMLFAPVSILLASGLGLAALVLPWAFPRFWFGRSSRARRRSSRWYEDNGFVDYRPRFLESALQFEKKLKLGYNLERFLRQLEAS